MAKRLKFWGQKVANGFLPGEFEHLSDRDKQSLRRLMARIAERSYRRGAQHGVELSRRGEIGVPDVDDWRYAPSLNKSPWLHGQVVQASIERLDLENSCLKEIGLGPPD